VTALMTPFKPGAGPPPTSMAIVRCMMRETGPP
jgi:hypothetical protein